jgi:hypothetical protein
MIGGVVSCTRTVKAQPFVFPLSSVATQRTVVNPSPNVDPEGGVQTSSTFVSQMSVAELA